MRRTEVVKTFHEYNHLLFGGRLQEPDITVRKLKTDLARWHEPVGEWPAGLLVMNSALRHPWTWRATLLHELIHIAVPEDDDTHGTLFTAECNRIGELLGLESCDVSDAWNWPNHHELMVPVGVPEAEWESED